MNTDNTTVQALSEEEKEALKFAICEDLQNLPEYANASPETLRKAVEFAYDVFMMERA